MQNLVSPKKENHIKPDIAQVKRKLWQGLSITLVENVLTKGLSFLTILLLSRNLGPEAYGQYSFVFVAIALMSAFFDAGMENTAVHFSAKDLEKQPQIFGLYLFSKCLISVGVSLFLWLGSDWVLGLMHKASMKPFLPYVIIGFWGESLFFVNDTYLQAKQQFKTRAILNILRYSTCLVLVGLMLANKHLSLANAAFLFTIPSVFTLFFLKRYAIFFASLIKSTSIQALAKSLWPYQKWMSIYAFANNLLGRVDFFMLGFWVGFAQLGIYNAAFQLCAVVSFLPYVLGKVLLPTLSSLKEEEVFALSNQMTQKLFLLAGAALVLVPVSQWAVPALLGKAYISSATIFQILLVAFLAGLVSMPYEQALYALEHPKKLSVYRYSQLFLIVALNAIFIPIWGIYAAAFITLAGRLLYLGLVSRFYQQCFSVSKHRQQLELAMKGCPNS